MPDPIFGISINRVDNEPRIPVYSDLSVVGVIGTAPAAVAETFPIDTPVSFFSSDAAMLTALGATGTIAQAIRLINSQLGDFQAAARLVVVRVADNADADEVIADIVGDGIGTGLSAFVRSGSETGVVPRLILAPGYTHQRDGTDANPVCAALPAVLSKLLAHAIVSGPTTSATAAKDWRETISSDRIIPIFTRVKVLNGTTTDTVDAAPAIAGVAVRRDFEKGGLPFWSWANQPLQGVTGITPASGFSMTDGATEGQDLLGANIGIIVRGEMGVESALSSSGFVFIGTDNAGDEDLWRFYNVTRGRDFIHLALLRTVRDFLGKFNITSQTIQAVLNTVGIILADLKAEGAILGYRVSFNEDQNTPEDLRAGRFTIMFEAEEAPVLRHIKFQSARYRPALEALVSDLMAQAGSVNG